MSITTSQQIGKWYDLYKSIEITYTKEILKTTGLDPRGVFLKCVGEQWPCVIYSASFDGAKVVASSKQAFMDKVKKANNLVSLRFSFKNPDKQEPLSFFIAARVNGLAPYVQSGGDLQFVNIQFTQRPPDDFIEILGRLLDANINSTRRRDDRILLTPDAMRRIGLVSKDTFVFVQGVPRKCILRDLSFSGCKAIIVGIAKFLVGKECTIKVEMEEPRESLELKGVIVRYEDVEGRKDLTAVAIKFDEHAIPMTYKIHINDFLSQVRQSRVEGPGRPADAESAAPPAPGAPAPGEGFSIP
ncbi:MAG: PilZ domain-containing protein [Treponema sp.]|nr:PilZ domain-containing protein [Treponema sp.]